MDCIFDYKLSDMQEYFVSIGEKKYKAKQIYEWLYKKRVYNFSDMSNISRALQEKLESTFDTSMLKLRKRQTSKLTNKYLFELSDGNLIEAVLMRHDYGLSVCVSSQVGCNMGCTFCESGRLKKVRDLKSGEIVRQILMIENDVNMRISSVVVMGIGEPFDNYANIMDFIRIINDPSGIAIGARHITVSTSGIVPRIYDYANEAIQTNLALSLHAPNNVLRNKIMRVNKAYPLDDVLKALKYYIEKTNRRVTIEYLLLDGVNDTIDCAKELAHLIKGLNAYVNLIPYNETSHIEYKKSKNEIVMQFYDTLKKLGINVTVRREFGGSIDAACGQLRASEVEK
ncbi:MAG: 23S rRNA (adenine(2503)-C(2))-methyltransferase RlmN [Bacilli bacterium]|jgi:23S rRNA (adenine2503-C2)-methyltransferase|nr:23S rRNA (adenine(2503)-C(2))-methyltransferase RlmN [Bacilli bacterium]